MRLPLHKLRPGHDSASLEWATELLAVNIESFRYQDGIDMPLAKACWPELEEGRSIGESRSGRTTRANQEFEESYLVRVPCYEYRIWNIEMTRAELGGCDAVADFRDFCDIAKGEAHIKSAGYDDLEKMFYLMVAMGKWQMRGEDDTEAVEAWSATLLRKYLLDTKLLNDQGVETATLEFMRETFRWAILRVLGRSKLENVRSQEVHNLELDTHRWVVGDVILKVFERMRAEDADAAIEELHCIIARDEASRIVDDDLHLPFMNRMSAWLTAAWIMRKWNAEYRQQDGGVEVTLRKNTMMERITVTEMA